MNAYLSRSARARSLWAALAVGVVAPSCTLEPSGAPGGGPPRVVATSPDHLETGFPRNGVVSFWFDLPLDPASIGPAAVDVTSREVRQGGSISYDPLERRLSWAPRGLLRTELAYDAEIDHGALRGLRDWRAAEPARVTFVTATGERELPADPPVRYASEVQPIFDRSCVSGGCHGAVRPPVGLSLSSPAEVARTALGRRTSAGWPGWVRVESGSAAWSYLVYKISGEPTVVGGPMPPDGALDREAAALLVRWIDQGAEVDRDETEP